jgi:outer membrane protein OmpA-like peptidoglycan-associated protein
MLILALKVTTPCLQCICLRRSPSRRAASRNNATHAAHPKRRKLGEQLMRVAILAAAFFAASISTAFAQDEMDRAERELRDAMAPAAQAGATVERVSPDEVRVRMPSDITFDFNRADVKREFTPRIAELARTLNRYPNMSVAITGHADAIGSDEYNHRLSERRAWSVSEVLTQFGVDRYRIRTDGQGEWAPIATNASEWGRARNRRVEISVRRDEIYRDPKRDD